MTTTSKFNCPVCGQPTLTEERMFEICPVCGWEDDNVQFHDPDYCGGANFFSLNQYRALWKQGKDVLRLQEKAWGEWDSEQRNETLSFIRAILKKRLDYRSNEYWTEQTKQELIDYATNHIFRFRQFLNETATEEEKDLLSEPNIDFDKCCNSNKRHNNKLF